MKNKTKYTNLDLEVDDDEKIKRLEEALEDIHYKFSEAETIASIGFWEIESHYSKPNMDRWAF